MFLIDDFDKEKLRNEFEEYCNECEFIMEEEGKRDNYTGSTKAFHFMKNFY